MTGSKDVGAGSHEPQHGLRRVTVDAPVGPGPEREAWPRFSGAYEVAMKTVSPPTDLLKLIRSLTLSRTPSSTPAGGLPIRQPI